jgi:hypothetical protein
MKKRIQTREGQTKVTGRCLKGISHNDRNMGKAVTGLESDLVTAHEVNNNICIRGYSTGSPKEQKK